MIFKRVFILFSAFALFCMPVQVSAQNAGYTQFLEILNDVNRIDATQNRSYDSHEKILKKRVMDNKNKVVGEVRDVILTPNGSIAALAVEFNRLRLSQEVFLNYGDMQIRTASNGYVMGFDDDQIEDIYPTLLSNIETAAGEDTDRYSVSSIIGAPVKDEEGRYIGNVKKVMFGKRGSRAELLYIALAHSFMRGRHVSIPYSAAKAKPKGNEMELFVSKEQADAILDYAKNEN